MAGAREEFEDRLKKYRELIKSISDTSRSKSTSARSLSIDYSHRRSVRKISKPPVAGSSIKTSAPSVKDDCSSLEVSGVSLLHRRSRIIDAPEPLPELQPLARSKAASSRRRLISNSIRCQDPTTPPKPERAVSPLALTPLVIESDWGCQTDSIKVSSRVAILVLPDAHKVEVADTDINDDQHVMTLPAIPPPPLQIEEPPSLLNELEELKSQLARLLLN